jgi:hypothetical protein
MTKNDAEKLLTNEEIYLGKSRAPYVDIREYIDCPLAWPACLVLVEYLCHQPLLSCGYAVAQQSGANELFY